MYMKIYKYFIYVKDKWVILQFKIVHDLVCHRIVSTPCYQAAPFLVVVVVV